MKQLKITSEYDGIRLDRYLSKTCSMPFSAAQRSIRKGNIKVDGKKPAADFHVAEGQIITVYERAPKTSELVFLDVLAPKILYEDEFLIAADKPPMLKSQPDKKHTDAMSERIKTYLKSDIIKNGGIFIPGVATRLDTNTSGIVLSGKTPIAAKNLAELTASHKITKKYYVLVKGKFSEKLKATHYGKKDEEKLRAVLYDSKQEGLNEYTSIFTPLNFNNGYTLLSAQLITGRYHQIRAQLAFLGFPVAGDIKYGDAKVNTEFKNKTGLSRQFLHCGLVKLPLWYDQSTLKITSLPPEDLIKTLKSVEIDFQELS